MSFDFFRFFFPLRQRVKIAFSTFILPFNMGQKKENPKNSQVLFPGHGSKIGQIDTLCDKLFERKSQRKKHPQQK